MKKRTIACIMAGILLIAGLCAAMGRKEKTADAGTETETISATERGAETDTEAEVTEETVKEAAAPQSGTGDAWVLHYVDAWGEWHDAEIDPAVSMHPYNWEKLKRDGDDMTYSDGTYHIRKGVDVSHHQGEIDWKRVRDAGYEFAILRIAYRGYSEAGNLMEDKRFSEYYEGAQAAGLDVGVYLFSQAVNEQEALEEAQFVLKLLDGKELQLPVTYDPETIRDDVARTDGVSGEQFTRNAIRFCDEIKKAGYEPMIYGNMVWEDELFDMKQLDHELFWYADYEPVPQTPYHFNFWQYSETGSVDGIEGAVDLDVQFVE